jgi:uncharacterized protein (DUF2225 family)
MKEKNNKDNTIRKMSFFTKELTPCPACSNKTSREDMLTGRGRLSAQELTIELRRQYNLVPGLGIITPLMYSLTVCPVCLCTLFPADFGAKNISQEVKTKLLALKQKRFELVRGIFKRDFDFRQPRTLASAAASYYLAISCYTVMPINFSPTVKCALTATRFYWLLEDLGKTYTESSSYFSTLRQKMLPNISKYFQSAKEKVLKGKEELPLFFGPDTDRNNGFEGFIYLSNYFLFITTPKDNPILLESVCVKIRQELSRIFGLGKVSKQKPAAILSIVRELYDQVDEVVKKLSINGELS